MDRHFHAGSAASAIGSAQSSNLIRKSVNSTVRQSDDSRGQSPFSPLLCVLLLVSAGILVKFGPALQSLHLVH